MDNVKDMIAKVTTIAIIAMMIGFLSPVLFPDRIRSVIVNHYITSYIDLNSKIDVKTNTTNVNIGLWDNQSFIYDNLSVSYDLTTNRVGNAGIIANNDTNMLFSSFIVNNSCYLQNLTIYGRVSAEAIVYISIFNSTNLIVPDKLIGFLKSSILMSGTYPLITAKTIYYQNFALNPIQTSNNTFFLRITTNSGGYRWYYNNTMVQDKTKSFSFTTPPDTMASISANFCFNLSYSFTSIQNNELIDSGNINQFSEIISKNSLNSKFVINNSILEDNFINKTFYTTSNYNLTEFDIDFEINSSIFIKSFSFYIPLIVNSTYIFDIKYINVYLNIENTENNYSGNIDFGFNINVNGIITNYNLEIALINFIYIL